MKGKEEKINKFVHCTRQAIHTATFSQYIKISFVFWKLFFFNSKGLSITLPALFGTLRDTITCSSLSMESSCFPAGCRKFLFLGACQIMDVCREGDSGVRVKFIFFLFVIFTFGYIRVKKQESWKREEIIFLSQSLIYHLFAVFYLHTTLSYKCNFSTSSKLRLAINTVRSLLSDCYSITLGK